MKHFLQSEMSEICRRLFQWFLQNERPLPWRKNYHAYEVWISEMMLQQTQMERGVQYYERWMKRFPCVEDVATASADEILQAWEGLGYYSRARNLHAAAKVICEQYKGNIPCNFEDLCALPGIGNYTASAIMGIAYEQDYVSVDANFERVFARLCNIEEAKLKDIVKREAVRMLPTGRARIYNQALMEFGALVCKKNPQCEHCPLTEFCESRKEGLEQARPVLAKKQKREQVKAFYTILYHSEKGFLLRKRPQKGLWANMWEFLGYEEKDVQKCPQKNKDLIQFQKELYQYLSTEIVPDDHVLALDILQDFKQNSEVKNIKIKHAYTKYQLEAQYLFWHIEKDYNFNLLSNYAWVKEIESVAMPSFHRKALALLEL